MILDWTQGALAEGLRCYRAGEFFAAHEHWEAVWLHAPEPEKTLLQALIQLAAAFHHHRRHNLSGARSMLQAALKRLAPYPASFQGISVASLSDEIRQPGATGAACLQYPATRRGSPPAGQFRRQCPETTP
jgi:predicted metal-dependent hydrolase